MKDKFTWSCLDRFGNCCTNIECNCIETSNKLKGRSSHCISVIGDTLYVFGGEIVPREPINSIFYTRNLNDKGNNIWKIVNVHNSNEPIARVGHSQTIIGKNIWIFGGRQGCSMSEIPMNDLWKFDTISNMWEHINSINDNIPEARSFHKMISIGNKLYIFGGCGKSNRLADLHCYDTDLNIWEKLPQPPVNFIGRGGAGFLSSSNDENLFIVGGFTGSESNAVMRYNILEKKWYEVYKEGNNLIQPFSVTSGITLDKYLIFFGGETNPSEKGHAGAGIFSNSLLVLDGITGKKITIPKILNPPEARGWFDSAKWNEKMVIFGGLTGNDEQMIRLNDIWILSLN